MSIQLIIGIIVIAATIYFLVKRYESRLVLFCAGVVLCLIALDPMAAFKAFSDAMKNAKVIEPIVASMGFAYVLKYTECDKHLVHLLAKSLHKMGPLLIPVAVLITAFINVSVTSSSGCAAAVGAILIPLLMKMGVHPAMAASAVLLGTYGSPNINPGYAQTIIIGEVSKTPIMDVVSYQILPITVTAIVIAIALTIVAYRQKEHAGYVNADNDDADSIFTVNPIKAIVPLLPLIILLLSQSGMVPGMPKVEISHAMIIGSIVAFFVSYKKVNSQKTAKEFFHGVGEGFGHIYGIITCSLIFVAGLNAIGLVKTLITAMSAHPEIAKIAGTAGPFVLATMTGSGDAAAIAFNTAVTVHAQAFGLNPLHLGAAVAAAGGLGRSMSPIAGACIICAGYAGVNPIELAKRNAIPTIIGCVVFVGLSLFIGL